MKYSFYAYSQNGGSPESCRPLRSGVVGTCLLFGWNIEFYRFISGSPQAIAYGMSQAGASPFANELSDP